jgi:D-glutamate cyclase
MTTTTLVEAPAVFENIDRITQIEMRPQGLPVGIIARLYEHARQDKPPISMQAAATLQKPAVRRVACLTGIVAGMLPYGEVDGPIGAAAVANALVEIGRDAAVVVPGPMVHIAEAVRTAMRASFDVIEDEKASPGSFDAAVTVEKLGRNRKGVYHTIFGAVLEGQKPLGDEFIEAMNRAGKPTIGLGDGGNEIGFGADIDFARKIVPHGADCGCPCGDGLVTATATGIHFPVNVSNFGAYAIVTALGVLEGKPLLLPSPARIAAGIEAAVTNGCLEGGTFEPGRLADDGIPLDGVLAYVELLRTMATQHFRTTPRHA